MGKAVRKEKEMNRTLLIMLLLTLPAAAQRLLTLQDALEIAMENSPQVKQARLSLERSSQSLLAQRAALKSHLSLSVNPFSYSLDRRFDRRTNNWYGSENKSSSADLRSSSVETISALYCLARSRANFSAGPSMVKCASVSRSC